MEGIKEISYGTLSGGSRNGYIVYTINFNGKKLSDADIADVIMLIEKHKSPHKNVNLTGTFPTDEVMFALIKSLKEHCQFYVMATIPTEILYPTWLTLADWITVNVQSPSWAPFRCSEIIYTIHSADTEEVLLPKGPLPLLYVKSDVDATTTFSFIKDSSFGWNIDRQTKVLKEVLFK